MHYEPTPEELERHRYEMHRHRRRNYLANSIEGGLFAGGLAFLNPGTVLPIILSTLGSADWLIAFSPMLMQIGFRLPPLFLVAYIERLHNMKRLIMTAGIFQRIPFFIAGVVLYLIGQDKVDPHWGITAVTLGFFCSGLFGGISQPAWMEYVAKTIPENRRASMWALRNIIGRSFGFLAGFLITGILDRYPGPTGFSWLFFMTFVMVMLSYAIFAMTQESTLPPKRDPATKTNPFSFMASLPELLRQDAQLPLFLSLALVKNGLFIVMPFLSIHAISTLEASKSILGSLVIFQMAGAILGNFIGGWIGDRRGGKAVLALGATTLFALCLWTPFASHHAEFLTIFCLFGFCGAWLNMGMMILNLDRAPVNRRIAHMALFNLVQMAGMLLAGGACTLIRLASQSFLWPAIATALTMLALLAFLARLPEPRTATGSPLPDKKE